MFTNEFCCVARLKSTSICGPPELPFIFADEEIEVQISPNLVASQGSELNLPILMLFRKNPAPSSTSFKVIIVTHRKSLKYILDTVY